MNSESKVVKKFNNFMPKVRNSKLLNQILLEGEITGSFFSSAKKFEMIIYYTPFRSKITDIFINGVDMQNKKLNLTFAVGDSIEVAREWISKNNYKIIHDIVRF